MESTDLIALTADIVAAHVSHNPVATADLPALIVSVHAALPRTGEPEAPVAARAEPAVSIRASVKPDYLVCLEDGKKLKMLKRYLRTTYDMSPDEYRAKWGLAHDYPMVAPNYAETRRTLAKSIGLGRGRNAGATASALGGTVAAAASDAVDTLGAAVEAVAAPVAKAVKSGRKRLGIAAAKAQAAVHLGGGEAPPSATDTPGQPGTDTAE